MKTSFTLFIVCTAISIIGLTLYDYIDPLTKYNSFRYYINTLSLGILIGIGSAYVNYIIYNSPYIKKYTECNLCTNSNLDTIVNNGQLFLCKTCTDILISKCKENKVDYSITYRSQKPYSFSYSL